MTNFKINFQMSTKTHEYMSHIIKGYLNLKPTVLFHFRNNKANLLLPEHCAFNPN